MPDQFIPLAEETGQIIPIGAWVLETACREAASWPAPYRVAVNVSPRQLARDNFATFVAGVLCRTGLDPGRLEIEITEAVLITDADAATRMLRKLKDLGVRIALDDFGTGYSSLSYLQRFPFDKVKIDRSFIRSMTDSDDARAIVRAILAMCHQLRLEVTAEGVESQGQLDELRAQGCDQIQGYLLGRPMAQLDVASYLLNRKSSLQTTMVA
jgi:EAL domain-containing protein (putative c-di-GMP-specific phosphodiesterase class I)